MISRNQQLELRKLVKRDLEIAWQTLDISDAAQAVLGKIAEDARRDLQSKLQQIEDVRQQRAQLRDEIDRLRKLERDLRQQLAAQERAVREITRDLEKAQKAHDSAACELKALEQELKR